MNFMNRVKVDTATRTCQIPDFIPCSPGMSVENLICHAPNESPDQCPITSLNFIPVDSEALEGEVVVSWTEEFSITYSKTFDSLPFISTQVALGANCNEDDATNC